MRIRQIALVARDLEPTVADLCEVLGIEVGFRDPGVETFGLVNAVMPIGDTFLEVVSPAQPNTSAGRLLDRRKGDGGYMVIVQSETLLADRRRIDELGVRVVWEIALDDAASVHLHPRDVGAAILSLDEMTPPESWRWGGPEWRDHQRTERVHAIRGATLQGDDPAALCARWASVLDRPAAHLGDGRHRIDVGPGAIDVVPVGDGRGEGLAGVALEVADRRAVLDAARARGLDAGADWVSICGTRFDLLEADGA